MVGGKYVPPFEKGEDRRDLHDEVPVVPEGLTLSTGAEEIAPAGDFSNRVFHNGCGKVGEDLAG